MLWQSRHEPTATQPAFANGGADAGRARAVSMTTSSGSQETADVMSTSERAQRSSAPPEMSAAATAS